MMSSLSPKPLVLLAQDLWHEGRIGKPTIFVCAPPACATPETVAATDPTLRTIGVGEDMLTEPAQAVRLGEARTSGFDRVEIIHPIAALVSVRSHAVHEFMATADTDREAISAIRELTERVDAA
jgi:hypothetical protein